MRFIETKFFNFSTDGIRKTAANFQNLQYPLEYEMLQKNLAQKAREISRAIEELADAIDTLPEGN